MRLCSLGSVLGARSGPRWARWSWRYGDCRKTLALARLLKAFLTFEGALDYGAWKLERHSGERLTITPRLRRFPWLFVWPELWRLWRAGRPNGCAPVGARGGSR